MLQENGCIRRKFFYKMEAIRILLAGRAESHAEEHMEAIAESISALAEKGIFS